MYSPSESPKTCKNMDTEAEQISTKHFTKYSILKNLVVVAVSASLIIGSDEVLLMYQSTMNMENGIGVASVAVQHACSVISSFFLPKYVIQRLGCKIVLVLSIFAYIPFFAVNYYPLDYLMILSSIINGMGASLFLGAVDTYINDLACQYDKLVMSQSRKCNSKEAVDSIETYRKFSIDVITGDGISSPFSRIGGKFDLQKRHSQVLTISESTLSDMSNINRNIIDNSYPPQLGKEIKNHKSEAITVRFFSCYSMLFQTCYIWSSVMSFYVLLQDFNQNSQLSISNETYSCGAAYCNDASVFSELTLQQPTTETRNFLITICTGLGVLAAILVIVMLDNVKPKDKNVTFSLHMLFATFQQIKKKYQLLLVPLTMHIGMMRGFYLADFTKLCMEFSSKKTKKQLSVHTSYCSTWDPAFVCPTAISSVTT